MKLTKYLDPNSYILTANAKKVPEHKLYDMKISTMEYITASSLFSLFGLTASIIVATDVLQSIEEQKQGEQAMQNIEAIQAQQLPFNKYTYAKKRVLLEEKFTGFGFYDPNMNLEELTYHKEQLVHWKTQLTELEEICQPAYDQMQTEIATIHELTEYNPQGSTLDHALNLGLGITLGVTLASLAIGKRLHQQYQNFRDQLQKIRS